MALRSMHIRVSEEEYDFICELAEGLDCSQAEIIRTVIFDTDMKSIVSTYRQRKGIMYLENYVECSVDDTSKNLLENCIRELNVNTQQIRRIGTNISALVRDIRNGKIQTGKENIESRLNLILKDNEAAMKKHGLLAEKMAGIMDNAKIKVRTKTEELAG